MGSSRITVISGVYIILGLYTFGFNSADDASSKLAVASAVSVQAEQLSQTGVSMALVVMGNNASTKSIASTQKTVMGGTVTYTAVPYGSSESQITSTAVIVTGAETKTIKTTSIANYNKGRWRISRSYTENL